MTTESIVVPVSAIQKYAAERAAAQVNTARPKDSGGNPVGLAVSWDEYLQDRIHEVMQSFCRAECRITGASAILRFSGSEIARLRAAILASPQVAAAAQPLLDGQRVELAGPLWIGGVQQLAAAGLLDAPVNDRVAALLLPPQPGESTV